MNKIMKMSQTLKETVYKSGIYNADDIQYTILDNNTHNTRAQKRASKIAIVPVAVDLSTLELFKRAHWLQE